MDRQVAETHAIAILGWLAGDEAKIGAFLAQSGTAPTDLRGRVGDAEFLASVVDFILSDDETVLAAAEACGLRPEDVLTIRALLPGGDAPHWT